MNSAHAAFTYSSSSCILTYRGYSKQYLLVFRISSILGVLGHKQSKLWNTSVKLGEKSALDLLDHICSETKLVNNTNLLFRNNRLLLISLRVRHWSSHIFGGSVVSPRC